ncbi:ATP-binding protein [Pontibacter sp. G13]|uniref:sensor histidine kinase n=1 Tax=Pontibacter sp. G13 TaxID=3074898 RepID=UPI00288C5B7F|nr:ATP-binding protein [Pontibacter sp. G13]WNJ16888.1 ATP-binding protein [Pontibacter sp. G13]
MKQFCRVLGVLLISSWMTLAIAQEAPNNDTQEAVAQLNQLQGWLMEAQTELPHNPSKALSAATKALGLTIKMEVDYAENLPEGVTMTEITQAEVQALLLVGQAYEAKGQTNDAAKKYRKALRTASRTLYADGEAEARDRLDNIGKKAPLDLRLEEFLTETFEKTNQALAETERDISSPDSTYKPRVAASSPIKAEREELPTYQPSQNIVETIRQSAGTQPTQSNREMDAARLASETAFDEAQLALERGRIKEYKKQINDFLVKEVKYQALIAEAKAEAVSDSLERVSLAQKMEQEAELDQQFRRFLFIVLACLGAIATLLSFLFVTKRKAHKEVSHAYDELEDAHQQLKTAQTQLVSAEKMASLGQLTAGIAHEINNPINFISGTIEPLKNDVSDMISLLKTYELIIEREELRHKFEDAINLKQEIELDYLLEEIEELLAGIDEGAGRTTEIVKGLRIFARLDESDRKRFDVHSGLDSTLALLKSSLGHIEVIKDYQEIPDIEGFPGKINQVFMNVLSNAIQAMPEGGTIAIRTRRTEEAVTVSIQDQGMGIPEEVKDRIFEPFFTTKDVGEGTGLGLSICHGIMEQHGGSIDIKSQIGQGTEVILTLPLQQELVAE